MKKKAVLIIHGFAGGTYDQEELSNYLELSGDFDVFTFTLPGHDGKRKDATRKKWLEESERQLKRLTDNGYRKIFLVGHSMGGVIACYLASVHKNIKKIVLLAPAFKYFTCEKGILNKLKEGGEAFKAYDNNSKLTFITKLPISAFQEFKKLVNENQDTIKKIKIPVLIIQGESDKVVPPLTGEYIFKNLNTRKKILLMVKSVGHEIFKSNRNEELGKIVKTFLNRFSFMIKEEKKEI